MSKNFINKENKRAEKGISKEVYMPIMNRDCYFISTDKPMLCANNDMKTTEPDILRRGKAFHKRVQDDWERTAKGGNLTKEHTIELSQISATPRRKRRGRLDLFVDELDDYVSVVEIKSTDWDKVKENNRKKLLGSHRRQIWKYIEEYLDIEKIDVCPGIIYPNSPSSPGLKEMIEKYMNDYGLQVVWYDDDDE